MFATYRRPRQRRRGRNAPEMRLDPNELDAFWNDDHSHASPIQQRAVMSNPPPKAPEPIVQPAPPPPEPEVQYRVWIRLPFPRGDFVDPPQVDWNADKDHRLWQILSRISRESDVDWDHLANQFQVTTPFILQQAAWLYERQLSSVRSQMRRVTTKDASPATGSQSQSDPKVRPQAAGLSLDGAATSATPAQPRHSPVPSPGLGASSKPSPSTIAADSTTLPLRPIQPRQVQDPSKLDRPQEQQPAPKAAESPKPPTAHNEPPSHISSSESSTSESDDEDNGGGRLGMLRNKAFKRPATRFGASRNNLFRSAHSRPTLGSEPSDQEDTPPFLAFRRPTDELTATLKGKQVKTEAQVPKSETSRPPPDMESSLVSSDPSDVAPYQHGRNESIPSSPDATKKPAPSAAAARRALQAQTSDGSPSMGSSFSDLDDASVTQSALEEALLSNLQRGGSRMSTLSPAQASKARPTRRD